MYLLISNKEHGAEKKYRNQRGLESEGQGEEKLADRPSAHN